MFLKGLLLLEGTGSYGIRSKPKQGSDRIFFTIETVTPYTADFDALRDVNHDEMDQDYLPELKESDLDISGYDTVFIGYPKMEYRFNCVQC